MQIYRHENLSPGLIRITDVFGVCCYLAIGTERACLIDTCYGLGNLREYTQGLTDKPIFVILTHGHWDHAGSSGQFEEVYMSPADMPVLRKYADIDARTKDMNSVSRIKERLRPEDLQPVKAEEEIRPLSDGQRFDLGGLTIEMISVPGHTPGMMCPLLVEERTVIFGDACGIAVLLFDEYSASVSQYRSSLLKLKQQEHRYDRILRNHGTFQSPKELLDNVLECCTAVLEGIDDHEPLTFHGYSLFSARKRAENGRGRADGKEGNLVYAVSKVC